MQERECPDRVNRRETPGNGGLKMGPGRTAVACLQLRPAQEPLNLGVTGPKPEGGSEIRTPRFQPSG